MSFSVPRKSPGLNVLANTASRTSAMICDDSDAERPGTKLRPGDFAANGKTCATMPGRIARDAKIVKILSYDFGASEPVQISETGLKGTRRRGSAAHRMAEL